MSDFNNKNRNKIIGLRINREECEQIKEVSTILNTKTISETIRTAIKHILEVEE